MFESFSIGEETYLLSLDISHLVNLDVELHKMDAQTAFLNGELEDEVYWDNQQILSSEAKDTRSKIKEINI